MNIKAPQHKWLNIALSQINLSRLNGQMECNCTSLYQKHGIKFMERMKEYVGHEMAIAVKNERSRSECVNIHTNTNSR